MKKYSPKLVYDYIHGNDITAYTLDELENDPTFMSMVIIMSKDKNFYQFAEDQVKQNHIFVKAIIKTFPSDQKFIISVADNYLSSNDVEINKIEILILLCEVIKDKQSEEYIRYNLILRIKYLNEKIKISIIKENAAKEPTLKKELGEGYIILYDMFNHNKIVLDYYTTEMIKDILSEKKLEEEIHTTFKNPKELEKIQLKNYLINLISQKDQTLASYVSANPHLLETTIKTITKIQNNWLKYINQQEIKLYNNIYETIHTYLNYEQPESSTLFSEEELLYLLGEELNIIDLIKKYDKLDEEYCMSIKEEIEEHPKENYTFIEQKHYNTLKKKLQKVLEGSPIDDAYTINTKKQQGKIISFPNKIEVKDKITKKR